MRFIIIDEKGKVVNVREAVAIVEGEIESALGECGQYQQPDGSFSWTEGGD